MDVTISIVTFNTKDLVLRCLSSLYKYTKHTTFEVVVIDNGSTDGTAEAVRLQFPHVTLIANSENNFFTKANNQSLAIAKGKYFLILNSDTFFVDNAIKVMVAYMNAHENVGACEGLELYENGNILKTGSLSSNPKIDFFELSWFGTKIADKKLLSEFRLEKKDRLKNFSIDVGCDAFLMVRKHVMDEINGYDQRFLLYYTENDLCYRIKKHGYEIIHLGNAKVMHKVSASANKLGWKKNDIYYHDMLQYYGKQHNAFLGTALYMLLKAEESIFKIRDFFKRRESYLLLFIILLGTFLRVYRINENFVFDGEIGDNLLQIKTALITHTIPLLGAPTSHPWLSFGPLFYWIYAPLLLAAKFNPLSHAYFGALIGALVIPANYFFVKKLFSQTSAMLSSYLIAISPLFLEITRIARFYGIVVLLIYPFLSIIFDLIVKRRKSFFLAGLLFGIILNFHYSPIFLVPFIISLCMLQKTKFSFWSIIIFLTGMVLPLLPLFYYYARFNPMNLVNIILWLPYRILGFFGIYHKNTFSQLILQENNASFIQFIGKSFFPPGNQIVTYLMTGILIIFSSLLIIIISKNRKAYFPWLFLLLWGLWGCIALFIHGAPPLHYYIPMLPLPIILFSILLSILWKEIGGKILTIILLVCLSGINFLFLFSNHWYYTQQVSSIHNYYIPYKLQRQVAEAIVKDANGTPFQLKRVGEHDKYPQYFSQNYIYLLWYLGNEPKSKAQILYTIYDDPLQKPKHLATKTIQINDIIITKQ